ncbi:TMEM175 family protein [Leucobacter sp. USCH14]|uniref:TMEM175 family protein n=1 Tax=Leucobacter sp. USCH14 TaxID=3024838 RepID=UPI0030970D6B
MAADAAPREQTAYAAARVTAFVDGVVAIALTLLILPLMESVGEVAGNGDDALTWLSAHSGQLLSFVLSFVLIALFWMIHHRLFADVDRVTSSVMWLLAAWMLTIVWLPVATAIAGRMDDGDRVARTLYIGSLILTALASLLIRLFIRAHPALHSATRKSLAEGIALDLSLVLLFGVALLLTLTIPRIGYWSMLVMLLSAPVQGLLTRLAGARP